MGYKHMAPESLNVENAVFSTKSDSWSFGVLSWEVLTRREPHAKIDIYEAARRIRKGARPRQLDKPPTAIVQLLDGTWKTEPGERMSIEQCVLLLKRTVPSSDWPSWPLGLKRQLLEGRSNSSRR